MARSAEYQRQMTCRECRLRIATLALAGSAELIETLWLVTTYFAHRRIQLVLLNGDPPRPQVVASVARGLLEQGYVDDALVLAALAITGGEEADVNRVGASALGVMLDPLLARPGIASTLRTTLYGS